MRLKRRNFSTKNHPLTNSELKKTTPGKPSLCNFCKYWPVLFHEYLNSGDSLTDSSSEIEETTLPEPLTSVYDPTTVKLSNYELNVRCTKAYEKYKNEFRNHPFSMYAKFSEKLTFLTP